ncbi:hypothetical protein K7I13_11030 [Brucepastera parasyntrophica]|uniref:hypothetical protein n=1 Tax=Brucepastera parasyntrophica TaxID=2880008 RepID=UPI00210D8D56|nr:hypothetical protein [Brucepastera parasyntrophica]ULQ59041.1 hypothetical protein K7I13_11030 [Brucepastera parasyntrophica]
MKNYPAFFIVVLCIGLCGCDLPTKTTANYSEPFFDVVSTDSFRGDGTIGLNWRTDKGTDSYIVMRGTDGIYGVNDFSEVYNGSETSWFDAGIETDIRYVYRLDKRNKNGKLVGQETAIAVGVGKDTEIDRNEPNNSKNTATLLNTSKRGTVYFFRFSDGRTLSDTDWFKIKVPQSKAASLRVIEDNAGLRSSFYIAVPGKGNISLTADTVVRITNESFSDSYIYLEICPVTDEFVEPDSSGGTIRTYTIILDSIGDTDGSDPGGTDPDPGGTDPDPGGTDPDPGGTDPDPGGLTLIRVGQIPIPEEQIPIRVP